MTIHRLRQAGEVSAATCAKVGVTTQCDKYTLQPQEKNSLRLGAQELDCFNTNGSAYLAVDLRSRDAQPVPACPQCGSVVWNCHAARCRVCDGNLQLHIEEKVLPHCLLTLRSNLAVCRIAWSPGENSHIEATAVQENDGNRDDNYPSSLEDALDILMKM